MTPELQEEIIALRSSNVTPKQIARKLGLKVSEVSAIIKEQAEQATLLRASKGELNPVFQCLVNASAAKLLSNQDGSANENSIKLSKQLDDDSDKGLTVVTIA
jgi:hypothetical protein